MKKWSFILLLIIIALGVITISRSKLPNTFTLHLVTDRTSSGGDRVATADLEYSNSILTKGAATYLAHPGTGGEINYTCVYSDGKWVNISNTSTIPVVINNFTSTYNETTQTNAQFLRDTIRNCSNLPRYPSTTSEVSAQIKDKEILPAGANCGHAQTCYSISK